MKKRVMSLAFATSLAGCVTLPGEESEQVRVLWDNVSAIESRALMGTVIGSEGHFYDYWLRTDENMFRGTLNQMLKKAANLGADTLFLYQPLSFSTSVTMFANAYKCKLSHLG